MNPIRLSGPPLGLLVLLTALAPVISAQSIQLTPVADVTIRSDQTTPNGSAVELGLGKDRNASGAIYFQRTLFRFDVTPLLGRGIGRATLRFYENRTVAAGGLEVDAYGLTQAFDESTVTWSSRPGDDGRSLDRVKVGDNFNRGWKSWDITPLVRQWSLGAPSPGCVLRLAREITAGAYRPGWGPSRESSDPSRHPHLLVDLSGAAGFGTGCGPVATWPRLVVTAGTPKIGTVLTIEGLLLAPNAASTLAIGLSNTTWNGLSLPLVLDPTPFPPCALLVAPDLLAFGGTDANGVRRLTVPVPNDPNIRGTSLYLQMATFTPAVHLTEGLELWLH